MRNYFQISSLPLTILVDLGCSLFGVSGSNEGV